MTRTIPLMLASLFVGAITGPFLLEAGPPVRETLEPAPPAPQPQQGRGKLQSDAASRSVDGIRVTPVVRAVRKAGPSVVSIQVGERVRTRGRQNGYGFNKLGEGSGVIVSEDGLVLTNWHVVRFKDRVANFECRVSLPDGRKMPAKVLNHSRENDLALIGIRPKAGSTDTFPPIQMGDSDTLMVGETVIAIGNPRGQENTVTTGVLSAVNRSLSVVPRGERRPIEFKELLQTDAAINPGNSGGALLDITGKLIGINTLMQIESQNIGYAIPVNHVRKVFEAKLLNVDHLGIWTGMEVDERGNGLVVEKVFTGSPAAEAGIRRGDRILQVGDNRVKTSKDYAKAVITYSPGQALPLYVASNGAARWRRVRGWDRASARIYQLTGLLVEPFDERVSRRLYGAVHDAVYGWNRGPLDPVSVRKIEPGSPGADLGLEEGDIIVGIYDRYLNLNPLVGGREALLQVFETARRTRPHMSVYRRGDGLLRGKISVRK